MSNDKQMIEDNAMSDAFYELEKRTEIMHDEDSFEAGWKAHAQWQSQQAQGEAVAYRTIDEDGYPVTDWISGAPDPEESPIPPGVKFQVAWSHPPAPVSQKVWAESAGWSESVPETIKAAGGRWETCAGCHYAEDGQSDQINWRARAEDLQSKFDLQQKHIEWLAQTKNAPAAVPDLSDKAVINMAESAGMVWLEPDDDPDGFPGSFDMSDIPSIRRLLAATPHPDEATSIDDQQAEIFRNSHGGE